MALMVILGGNSFKRENTSQKRGRGEERAHTPKLNEEHMLPS